MKGRFGREIICPTCGKDDKVVVEYSDRHTYHYRCSRCHRTVPG